MSKTSLRNIDIIMSFRAASEERTDNLYSVLRHLDHNHCDYRLWLMEADTSPKFEWQRVQDTKIRHVFLHHGGPFPKSLLYNTGVRLAASPVFCFHDADSIANPWHLRYSIDELLDQQISDVICPYLSIINVSGTSKQAFAAHADYEALATAYASGKAEDFCVLYASNNGCIGVFRKDAYMRIGGYDTAMEGWGGEDDELLVRARRLGVRWNSLHTPVFHLHHDSASRSALIERERDSANTRIVQEASAMPLEELERRASRLAAFFA